MENGDADFALVLLSFWLEARSNDSETCMGAMNCVFMAAAPDSTKHGL